MLERTDARLSLAEEVCLDLTARVAAVSRFIPPIIAAFSTAQEPIAADRLAAQPAAPAHFDFTDRRAAITQVDIPIVTALTHIEESVAAVF